MLKELSNSKFLIPVMMIFAVLAAASGFYISLKQSQHEYSINNDRKPNIEGLFWPNPKQIQEFDTTDQSGNTFNLNNLNEKWSFVFFGYTHCPDICPITMTVMNQVYTQLSTDYKNLQIIFVSVDPQRDTIEKLQQYVSYFNPDFYGLGGSSNKVDSLTKQIGVAYYLNNQNQAEGYLVDHTASIFIFDPKARLVGKLSAPHEAEKIKNQFIKIKEFIDAQS